MTFRMAVLSLLSSNCSTYLIICTTSHAFQSSVSAHWNGSRKITCASGWLTFASPISTFSSPVSCLIHQSTPKSVVTGTCWCREHPIWRMDWIDFSVWSPTQRIRWRFGTMWCHIGWKPLSKMFLKKNCLNWNFFSGKIIKIIPMTTVSF